MAKRPAFQFYPGDWLRDTALRSCSVAARGLWIEMICLMHEGSPYGYLRVGTKPITAAKLAQMAGASLKEVKAWLEELEEAEVFSRDEDGCIFSRRMVKDEAVRNARAAGGKLGGNPALVGTKKVSAKDTGKVDGKVNHTPNLGPTPAVAVASSKQSPPNPRRGNPPVEIKTFLDGCRAESVKPVPDDDPVFDYAERVGIPHEFLRLAWREFVDRHRESGKRYRDWRKAFRNCVRSNWYRLWWADADGQYQLTTAGVQAERNHQEAAA